MKRVNTPGFTIIELLIATTIFSVILLLLTSGFILIGKTFLKGVNTITTQETTRTIMNEIAQAIQYSGSPPILAPAADPASSWKGICVNNVMYSFRIGQQVINNQNGLVAYPVNGGCAGKTAVDFDPPDDTSDPPISTRRELLGQNMRLAQLSLNDLQNGLYQLTLQVSYGDDDLLNPTFTECTVSLQVGGQFCATSRLTTVIRQRINQ